MIDDLHDALTADEAGAYSLRNTAFTNEAFNRVSISPDSRFGNYEIADVQFLDCRITNGRFSVYGASRLSRVSFVNLACDEYSFHADNRLDNVSISGGAGSMLRLRKPLDRNGDRVSGVTLRHPTSSDGVCLDISDYLGVVDIFNADPINIRLNPAVHVVCERTKLESVDWKRDPILSKTDFDVMLLNARLSDNGVYIGSTIDEDGEIIPTFDAAVKELRRRGLVD